MKVVLVTQKPFVAAAVDGIREILCSVGHEMDVLEHYTDEGQVLDAVKDADAIIVRSDEINGRVLEAARNLRIVVRAGAGYDNVDLQAAAARKIVVENTPGQNANAVAELALGLMIYIARNQFTPGAGIELAGRTIGLQAYGNVGRLVGRKAAALGMKVKAFDPFQTPEALRAAGAEPVDSLEELYRSCDFVSVHIPSTPQTARSIGYDLISKMPEGGVLVNTARKEVIDEEGLRKAMEERKGLKYVADVAPSSYDELREQFGGRIFATPKKMGAQSEEANIKAGLAAARQIVAFFEVGCTDFQVNKW